MGEPRTCGDCGPDGGRCEYLDDDDYCSLRGVWSSDDDEACPVQVAKRSAIERAEKAEARAAELEAALREVRNRVGIAMAGEASVYALVDAIGKMSREIIDEALWVKPWPPRT